MMILKMDQVSMRYAHAEKQAVTECSMCIHEGAFIRIEGVSGSGKSTLLMMAGGLLKPSDGRVLCDDKDIYTLNDKKLSAWRAKTAGYLYQNVQFVQALTVKENMKLSGMLGNNPDVDTDALIRMLDLEGEADRLPSHLSGGQKRRAMIGCVMAREPKLILADEPTNDLDECQAEKLIKLLRDYASKGNAVVLVTHDKRWASLVTERYHMQEGRIEPVS